MQLALSMKTDWTVLTAQSGREALQIAASARPDVILLDLMMPDLDGRATIEQLKANPQTRDIPVILVTAKVQSSDRDCLADLDAIAISRTK